MSALLRGQGKRNTRARVNHEENGLSLGQQNETALAEINFHKKNGLSLGQQNETAVAESNPSKRIGVLSRTHRTRLLNKKKRPVSWGGKRQAAGGLLSPEKTGTGESVLHL